MEKKMIGLELFGKVCIFSLSMLLKDLRTPSPRVVESFLDCERALL